MPVTEAVTIDKERLEWLEYRNDVLKSAWCIIADGIKAADPDADPEYDTNNFYDYIRKGVNAQHAYCKYCKFSVMNGSDAS